MTLRRRQRTLAVRVPHRADGPLPLLVDGTGIELLGDGGWRARGHGPQGRRRRRRAHLAMDTTTPDIRAVQFTPGRDSDGPVLPDLLGQVPEDGPIGTLAAEGAHDTRRHAAIAGRGVVPIIPIREARRALEGGRPGGVGPRRDPARRAPPRAGVSRKRG